MNYPILIEFESNIELNPPALATSVLGAVRERMPELINVTVYHDEAVKRAVDRMLPSTPPAPTHSTPPTPNAAVLSHVIEAARSILSDNSETDAQSSEYEHLLDAYEQLVSLIATASTTDPNVITLSRAALTAGLF